MSLYEKYQRKKPAEFIRLVGVNYGTFQIILQKVTEAVKAGQKGAKPKDTLLIKAEKEVPLKDISHIASAAGELALRLAVVEKEGK